MSKQKYIAELQNHLDVFGINIANSDDENILVFNGLLHRADSGEGILYFLSLKIDIDNNFVSANQEVSYNQQRIKNYELHKIKLMDKSGKTFIASEILNIVKKITKSSGFELTQSENWYKEQNDSLTAKAPFVQIVDGDKSDGSQKQKRSKMKYIVVFSLIALIVVLVIILVTRNNPAV